ncbi:hypothetical protein NAT51_12470 [Flavobacterium amniphilum]|uniref:hypothetical protein n=1 Tax=Flavobacterium amniphilum TaxID=1834035 RepID=UPI00202A55C2|nr:hypothetical protein [Flavobacterium amniphilum]MCL9805757.1 hypothetical protein [Flavobacterium amniphilum]MCL9806344.1 hypothetical protein [Flavobacterium amniphilum]
MNFKILLSILFTQFLIAQNKPVVYENDSNAYYNKDRNKLSYETTFCDLTLSPDSTFSFYHRPHISCFTWKEVKGKWKKKDNIYTFSSQYDVFENDTRKIFRKDSSEKYQLKFSTDKKSELKNRTIKVGYIYDFDSNLKNMETTMEFNQYDNIEIPFKEIPNHDKLASIRIDYQLSASEKRNTYITENRIVNKKEREIPNIVTIEFVEEPKKETVYRTTIGRLADETLEIISFEKTKTSLPEYLEEIGFERYYELRKEN